MAEMAMSKTVDRLNSLLRGEISAVETYRQALDAVKVPTAVHELSECERSHEIRVAKLRDRVLQIGGKPADGSGAWGTFTKLVQGSADALGAKAAIAVLEEGEDRGVADYRKALPDLDAESQILIEQELLPSQMRTHRAIASLKSAMQ